jgi:squalene cyclase
MTNLPAALLLLATGVGSAPAQDRPEREAPWEITPEVVRGVDRGLEWLARAQRPDGSWSGVVGYKLNTQYSPVLDDAPHLGVTSLACMSFMAGGNVPGRGPYAEKIAKGLEWVLSSVSESGYIRANESRMYDHAFATLLLAEIYGMTHHPEVGEKLQRAVDLTIKSQNVEGGWRYEPFAPDSDMSITVCQVVALRAARNIGIRVPKSTIDRAIEYVRMSAVRDGRGGFSPFESDERGSFRYQRLPQSRSSWPLTAAGLVTLHGAGVYSGSDIEAGLDYLRREMDRFSLNWSPQGHYFFWYGHYYAVQAMYIAGGDYWKHYFQRTRELLLRMQQPDGSWENAQGPGPNFATAVATLVLQIPYRYLPIFQR